MISIKVPATSANLGIGFDCLGLALDLYNEFEVQLNDSWQFENVEKKYCNQDNLFVRSFNAANEFLGNEKKACYLKIKANIPVSRGLGSSASLIVGGILAADYFSDKKLNDNEKLLIATSLEGHPDNVAPALFGGLICSIVGDDIEINKFEVNEKYHFYCLINAQHLSTEAARKVLPQTYKRQEISINIASALMGIEGLRSGKSSLVKMLENDHIHEPYRKELIENYEPLKKYCHRKGCLAFLISGSGSTCLAISDKEIDFSDLEVESKVVECKVCNDGGKYE